MTVRQPCYIKAHARCKEGERATEQASINMCAHNLGAG